MIFLLLREKYYTGTNRLKRVSGSTDQFTYDYNGNMTNDYMNNNTGIKYDHRNLITEITKQNLNQDPPTTYITRYRYDEAGNRTRKTVFLSNEYDPRPLPDDEADLPPGWSIIVDDYYSRDVSGKEIGVYSSYTLQYWNVWSGNEITGRINYENNSRYYYLKDHLGSVRAVIDEDKKVITAQDYDAWGYYLENRTYEPYTTKNKFTGKERDSETSYDYFGARYYDSRIGRWGATDPLFEKHIQFTPYNYVLNNSMILIDPDGRQIYFSDIQNIRNEQITSLRMMIDPKYGNYINYTMNDNGEYLLDVASLNENMPSRVTDFNFTNLLTIVNSNEPVQIELRDADEIFHENQKITFNQIEQQLKEGSSKNYSSYGLTLVSGNRYTPEEPKAVSVNGKTVIYINRKYGTKEGVKTLAHEFLHAKLYILNVEWGENSNRFIELSKKAENQAGENYDKWKK